MKKSRRALRDLLGFCALIWVTVTSHCSATAQTAPSGLIPIAPAPLAPPDPATLPGATPAPALPVMNQPIVINTSEKVELERLRLQEEAGKTLAEKMEFEAQIARLQQRLASSSLTVAAPGSIPTDYRSFLSQNQGQIATAERYYALLKATLNDLTPTSPYLARTKAEGTNLARASQILLELDKYPEDDGVSRTLRGHISEFFGGRVDEARRINAINAQLAELDRQKKQLEFTLRNMNSLNPLDGRPRHTDDDRRAQTDRIAAVAESEQKLKKERDSLSHTVTEVQRKLQYQQYIVQLALQQRYIHALIACGFYRGSPARGDLGLSKEALSSLAAKPAAPPVPGAPLGGLSPTTSILPVDFSSVTTISGMEAFLTNRVRDAMKDREAFDNMLRDSQLSAAENLLRKMVMTGKYQPELNTIPLPSRQKVLGYGQEMSELSQALLAKDYERIKQLAIKVGTSGADTTVKELEVFATEQPVKARHMARQAELALGAGDRKAAQSFSDAAIARAPLDAEVQSRIGRFQDSLLSNSKAHDDLRRIVEAGDYEGAFKKAAEFAVAAATAPDKELKSKFDELLEKEKKVRAALEKCDALEKRSAYQEVWLALATLDSTLAEDARVARRMGSAASRCPRFVETYSKALQHEASGADAIALAWYLSALAEAPSNKDLVDKITQLSGLLLNR